MKKSIFLTLVAILIMGGSIFASGNEIVELRKQYKTPTANLSLELKKGSDTYNGEWVKNNVNVVVTKPSGLENMTDVYYKKEGDASYTSPVGSVYTNNTITVVFKETMDAEVTFVGVDVTGNEVTLPTSAYAIKIDKEAPKIVNVDKTATGTSVILKVEVEDLQSGVKSYAVSTSTLASTWTTLETPITNGSFNVEVNGDKSVYLWLQDSVGNVSTMQEIIIYKDITPPTGTIEIQGNKVGENTYVNSTNVTLKLTAQDNASTQNEIKMQVYNEKDFDNLVSIDDIEWQDFKEEITNWNLEEEDGQKVVYLVLKDAMGNVSVTIYGDTVNYKVHHFIKDVAGVEYALYKTTTEKTLIGKHLQLEKEKIAIKGMTYEKVSTSFDGTPTVETVVAEDGSTEIYVHYTRNKYNVTLNNGDGTYGNITVTYGGTYKNLPELTRVGYSFNGWRNAAGMLVKNSTEVTITQDEELTANWTANRYEVTLDPNGGTVDKASITVSYGSVYQNLPEPTKEGYDFTGWYNSKGEKITKDTEVTITENETLTANWEVARFEVTLNTNGGTVENTILKVLPNGTYENLPTPTREGYTFTGWYTSITDGTKIESTTTVISNAPHTLYARWQINTYTITFDSNGGTSVPSITQEYGTKITVATNPTKEGYDFYGWLPKLPSTMPAEDTTLVAEWRIAKYQITFNTDGGTAIDSIYEEYGTEITPPEDPTKEGYQFIGWDKEIPKTMPSQDMIITAQWQKVESYAVYSETDNSLTFYKNGDVVTVGEKYNKKTVTNIYVGFDMLEYTDEKDVPWYDIRENVITVNVQDEIAPMSTANWFYEFRNTTQMNLKNLNTSNVTNMFSMFLSCTSLTSLDVSNFNTSKVTDMAGMFIWCTNLKSLDLSNFNTSNVVDMRDMFYDCNKLETLNISKFDTSKVTSMLVMFYNCKKLTTLDVSSFDTSNVTNMAWMFDACSSLTSLDVSKFDTSNVTDMSYMFGECSSITSLDLTKFNTSKVTDMTNMFENMTALQEITLGASFSFSGDGSTSCTLPTPDPNKITGADGNWYNKDTGAYYIPSKVPNKVAATYSAIPVYVVTFDANGGQIYDLGATTTTRRVTLGKTYGEGSDTIPTAERTGYEFMGWNTQKDGTGTTITSSTVVDATASGLKLYAQWEAVLANMVTKGDYVNYNVSYNNVNSLYGSKNIPKDSYSGWRVLSITEENGEKYVNIIPEGVPMSYVHSSTATTNPGQTGKTNLTTGFFNTAINSTSTNDTYHLCGFKDSSENVITTITNLKSIFANNEYTLVESGVPRVRSMIKSDIDNYIGSVTENATSLIGHNIFAIESKDVTSGSNTYASYYLATEYDTKYLWNVYTSGAVIYTYNEAGIRPVVTLKATVKTTGQDENGIWQLK